MSPPINDPEVLAFIAKVDRLTPPGRAARSIVEQRELYDAMSDAFREPRPDGIEVRDHKIAGTPCRRYGGDGYIRIIFLHGGGFVVGGLESHDDIAAEIAVSTGLPVDAVDYRLAPENPHPAAFEDALTVARASAGPLILVGDSAGGTLAASVAWRLRETERIAAQVLIYPSLGGETLGLPSYTECADAPLLTTADLDAYRDMRGGGSSASSDPTYHVLAAQTFNGIAPAYISAAGVDPLRDDGIEYARRLTDAGIPAHCDVEAQLPHMWLRARHRSSRARAAFDRVLAAIARFAAGISAR